MDHSGNEVAGNFAPNFPTFLILQFIGWKCSDSSLSLLKVAARCTTHWLKHSASDIMI